MVSRILSGTTRIFNSAETFGARILRSGQIPSVKPKVYVAKFEKKPKVKVSFKKTEQG